MVTYLGVDQTDTLKELEETIGAHARFVFLEKLDTHRLDAAVDANGHDA